MDENDLKTNTDDTIGAISIDTEDSSNSIYEIGYQITQTVAEGDLASVVEKIKETFLNLGGKMISEGVPQLRDLSYEIKKKVGPKYEKYSRAYFGWVKFEIERDMLAEIKKRLESIEEILRFMIISTVRENTMVAGKVSTSIRKPVSQNQKDGAPDGNPLSTEAIDEEIAKTLEDLEIK